MKTLFLILICSLCMSNNSLQAQDSAYRKAPAQISLIYPLGSSGKASKQRDFSFSINSLIGVTGKVSGFELAGLGNINRSSMRGFQIAGLWNTTKGNFRGLRLAGLFNRTKVLSGVQLALINISDTVEKGMSIGILNIVKTGGYHEWELSFSDYQNVGLSYKHGTKGFYNIYNIGANFLEARLWSAGVGFGHLQKISKNFNFQPEAIVTIYFPVDFKDYKRTITYKLKLGFVYTIYKNLAISVAPDIYYADSEKHKNGNYGYKFSPVKPISESKNSDNKSALGLGISAGLIFRKF
jgi:hypothetical protein